MFMPRAPLELRALLDEPCESRDEECAFSWRKVGALSSFSSAWPKVESMPAVMRRTASRSAYEGALYDEACGAVTRGNGRGGGGGGANIGRGAGAGGGGAAQAIGGELVGAR